MQHSLVFGWRWTGFVGFFVVGFVVSVSRPRPSLGTFEAVRWATAAEISTHFPLLRRRPAFPWSATGDGEHGGCYGEMRVLRITVGHLTSLLFIDFVDFLDFAPSSSFRFKRCSLAL